MWVCPSHEKRANTAPALEDLVILSDGGTAGLFDFEVLDVLELRAGP